MIALLFALALLNPAVDWELLGTRRVSFTLDHDAILVGARHDVKVIYANGEKTTVHVYGSR